MHFQRGCPLRPEPNKTVRFLLHPGQQAEQGAVLPQEKHPNRGAAGPPRTAEQLEDRHLAGKVRAEGQKSVAKVLGQTEENWELTKNEIHSYNRSCQEFQQWITREQLMGDIMKLFEFESQSKQDYLQNCQDKGVLNTQQKVAVDAFNQTFEKAPDGQCTVGLLWGSDKRPKCNTRQARQYFFQTEKTLICTPVHCMQLLWGS